MTARRSATMACVAALAAGCGGVEDTPVSSACTEGPDAVVDALRAAPRPVTLSDGTSISGCLRTARSAADLQNVGVTLVGAAERLERTAPRDPRAALELGYLVGAARRGTPRDGGIVDELLRRVERSADLEGMTPQAAAALEQGLATGERAG